MFGSAAAKYLAATGAQMLIIGAAEPQNLQTHEGVFGSHYDEARITRIVDPDPHWGALAAQSIAQYPLIEQRSGIKFHHAVGCLRVAHLDDNGRSAQRDVLQNGLDQNAVTKVLSGAETAQQFPYFHFAPHIDAIWERGAAGYINPRQLVKAQLKIAAQHGAILQRETAQEIIPETNVIKISTREGHIYKARKVLLAAGAYTQFLLRRAADLQVNLVQVILAEVAEPALEMPSLIYTLKDHPLLEDVYLLPPVPYPDGKWYLKIGAFSHHLPAVNDENAMRQWFHQEPNNAETQATEQVLQQLMPALNARSFRTVPCLRTNTPQGQPHVKVLLEEDSQGRIAVATGGCGRGAKSSDAIGKLGAELLL